MTEEERLRIYCHASGGSLIGVLSRVGCGLSMGSCLFLVVLSISLATLAEDVWR